MPCSKATQEIEKQEGGYKMSLFQRLRLQAHLAICKWCSAYRKKFVYLDKKLSTIIRKEQNTLLKDIDIQNFKDNIKEKIKK